VYFKFCRMSVMVALVSSEKNGLSEVARNKTWQCINCFHTQSVSLPCPCVCCSIIASSTAAAKNLVIAVIVVWLHRAYFGFCCRQKAWKQQIRLLLPVKFSNKILHRYEMVVLRVSYYIKDIITLRYHNIHLLQFLGLRESIVGLLSRAVVGLLMTKH